MIPTIARFIVYKAVIASLVKKKLDTTAIYVLNNENPLRGLVV